MRKNFVEELRWRGMLAQIMPGTEELLQKEMVTAYLGTDPTADSLHIGHLCGIMMLRHLQRCGHKPIILVGGATGMIGDPSGKSQERNLLNDETLRHNQECIKAQVAKFLDFDSKEENAAEMVNNYDWMKNFTFLDFAREVLLEKLCRDNGSTAVLSEGWGKGGDGAAELAKVVAEIADSGKANYHPLYKLELPLADKIRTIAKEIYRAADVEFEPSALKKLKTFEENGYGKLPVCIAKTQNSISHDPKLIGAPSGYTFPVRDVQLYAGAGFVVALAGDIMTMPGLPKLPAALDIDVDDNGVISGLF